LSRVPTPDAPVVPSNGILNPAPDQIFWFIPNNSEFPYVASRNLTVEQALPGKITLEVAYVGNRAFHQPVQYDTNQAPPGAGAAGRVLLLRYGRTSPTNTRANIRDANYNSLQILVKRRFSAGIHFQLAYTFAKALDNLQVS